MHPSAMQNAGAFFEAYAANLPMDATILDIGAQDVNGSLRSVAPPGMTYVGVDFVEGRGVDVVLDDPYALPFPDASVDVIVSSSCFEHSEMFWVLWLELLRVTKPAGLIYVNAPSNGMVHRYPVDCWRFYPDAGQALCTWGERNGYAPALLESFISPQSGAGLEGWWNDFVAVVVKDVAESERHPERIAFAVDGLTEIRLRGVVDVVNATQLPEDQRKRPAPGAVAAQALRAMTATPPRSL